MLVAESATKQMFRQNLRYSYMYAESTEIFFVESTNILEKISRLVSGIQEYTETKLGSHPVHSLASLCALVSLSLLKMPSILVKEKLETRVKN